MSNTSKHRVDSRISKMVSDPAKVHEALSLIRQGKAMLREQGVLRHEKAIHCEIAEWVIAEFLDGSRAISGNQKGWDIELLDGSKIQVKSHAKARTNMSNWTTLSAYREEVTDIYIVVFSPDYYIIDVFTINADQAYEICSKKREITWRRLEKEGKALNLNRFREKFPFLFKI